MRDQLKRRKRENYNENVHKEILELHYPSWDMEELDLSARYKKVENYISEQEMDQPQIKKSNYYKPYRNE
ncbi:MAG: hypothetical protein WEA58_01605 [Balneolaceae bacterium]